MTTVDTVEQPIGKVKVGRIVLIGLGLVALIVILANLTGTRADLGALKKMGVPTDDATLEALDPPDSENAAILYEKGRQIQLDQDSTGKPFAPFVFSGFEVPPLTADDRKQMDDALKQRAPILDAYRQGTKLSRCVYLPVDQDPQNEEGRFFIRGRGYRELMDVSRDLISAAGTEMFEGNTQASLDDLAATEAIAAQLTRNPGSESFHAWQMQSDAFHRNWVACVRQYKDNRAVIEAATALLQRPYPVANIRQAALGDFADRLDVLKVAQSDPFHYKVHVRLRSDDDYKDNGFFMRQAVNQMIHEWRTVFESMPTDPNDIQGFKAAFLQGSIDLKKHWPANELLKDPFPEYVSLCQEWASTVANHRLAVVASNVLTYRLDHKTLPDKLPNLGENSIDPFNGAALSYKKNESGFSISSVGPDGTLNPSIIVKNRPTASDDIAVSFGD